VFSKPAYGWSRVEIGEFCGEASYLTDVPFDILSALIAHFEYNIATGVLFDEEGSDFVFMVDKCKSYILSDRDELRIYEIHKDDYEIAEEIINDIEEYIDGWAGWLSYDHDICVESRKTEIQKLINELRNVTKGALK